MRKRRPRRCRDRERSTISPSPAGRVGAAALAEDAAGNQQPANASAAGPPALRPRAAAARLREPERRGPDARRPSSSPTGSPGSPEAGSRSAARGPAVGRCCRPPRKGDRLVTRIDDASLPPGDYELRATAHDQADNLAGTDRRLDGQPMRLKLPLRIATAMKAGVVEKRSVTRKGKKGKVRRTVLEPQRQGARSGAKCISAVASSTGRGTRCRREGARLLAPEGRNRAARRDGDDRRQRPLHLQRSRRAPRALSASPIQARRRSCRSRTPRPCWSRGPRPSRSSRSGC